MAFLSQNGPAFAPAASARLFRALAAGDLPAAFLLARPVAERPSLAAEGLPFADAFNCALCLYRLGETEKALDLLVRAEQALGEPPELGAAALPLFLRALEAAGLAAALLPLDPDGGDEQKRYALIRIRWLRLRCLTRLGRSQEAAALARFLAQYNITE